jgi:carbamoyl-phosphate synthase large subunit
MRSTGEVLGLADCFGLAFYKSQIAAGLLLPKAGAVLITVADRDKEYVLPAVKKLVDMGFKIVATENTAAYFAANGIQAQVIKKLHEGRPNILDALANREVQLVINTPAGKESAYDDSYIRMAAIKYKIPYITTTAAAVAAAEGIKSARERATTVKSLQEYHRDITVIE